MTFTSIHFVQKLSYHNILLPLRYKFRLLTSHKNIWPCFSLPFFISHSSSCHALTCSLFYPSNITHHSLFSLSPSQTFFLFCGSLPKQFPEKDSKSELPTGKLCFKYDSDTSYGCFLIFRSTWKSRTRNSSLECPKLNGFESSTQL
jgi:hypothetical protein